MTRLIAALFALLLAALSAGPAQPADHLGQSATFEGPADSALPSAKPDLTEAERDFLKAHPVIRAHNERDWAPFNYYRDGQPQGFSIDLLNLLAQRLGIRIDYVSGPSWDGFIDMLKRGQIDLIDNLVQTPDRDQFALFTTPTIAELPSIVSRSDKPLRNAGELDGKTVAVVRGFWYQQAIERLYPTVKLHLTRDTTEALKAVAFGQADAAIDEGPVLQYLIVEKTIPNVSVAGEADLGEGESKFNRIGVRKDWPLLRSALDKALATLSFQEFQGLKQKWMLAGLPSVPGSKLDFTAEEQAWLAAHPRIRVHNETNWPPINFAVNGKPSGYSIDYMTLLARKIGVAVDYVTGPNWDEFLAMIRDGRIDVMLNIKKTAEREQFLSFTEPYLRQPMAIVARSDDDFSSMASLRGRRVAAIRGFFVADWLKKHPEMTAVLCESAVDCLKMVSFGKADATIDSLSPTDFLLRQQGLSNLHITGEMADPELRSVLSLATRKDQSILRDILAKAMAQVQPDEETKIQRRWLTADLNRPDSGIRLTVEERAWLKAHPKLTSSGLDKEPFLYTSDGKTVGFLVDYVGLIAAKLGVRIDAKPSRTVAEVEGAVKSGSMDFYLGHVKEPRFEADFDHTVPVLRLPSAIISREDKPIHRLDALAGQRIASVKGRYVTEWAGKTLRDVHIVDCDSSLACLTLVSSGQADATLETRVIAETLMKRHNLTNIKIMAELSEPATEWAPALMTAKTNPILSGLLGKAIAAITYSELTGLYETWFGTTTAQGRDAEEIKPIGLTSAEQAFVQAHPTVRILIQDRPPFSQMENGRPVGFSVDYLSLLLRKIGLTAGRYDMVPISEGFERLQKGEADILSNVARTEERAQSFDFTDPLHETPKVIIARAGSSFPDIASLAGKRVAVERKNIAEKILRDRNSTAVIVDCPDLGACVQMVSNHEADALIETAGLADHLIASGGLGNLTVVGVVRELDLKSSLALQKGQTMLRNLLNRAIANTSTDERMRLAEKWMPTSAAMLLIKPPEKGVFLTTDERAYLTQKGVIKMCVEPDWLPFIRITEKGDIEGIAAEMVRLMQERLGVKFVLLPTKDWNESLAAMLAHQCDISPAITDLPGRRDAMTFTRPYIVEPLVIATRSSELFVKDGSEIGDRKVGITRGFSFADLLRQRYPNMQIIDVENVRDGLDRVRRGDVWGYIDVLPAVGYIMQKYSMLDLKIAGKLEFNLEDRVASRSDEPLLASIMQKAVDSISEDERRAIISKWVSVRFEQGFDYVLMWKIVGGVGGAACVIVGVVILWNRRLGKLNKELELARMHAVANQETAIQLAESFRIKSDEMATLLDNSGQGFLSFSKDMTIDSGFSRACLSIFNRPALDLPLPDLLCPEDAAQRGFIAKTLARIMGSPDDPLRRDAYLSLLPAEYRIGQRCFEAEYKPLDDGRMMLILTDVTDEKLLKEKLALERKRLEFVVNALENRDDLLETVRDFGTFRSRILPDLLSFERQPPALLAEVFRQIHTFKSRFAQASLPTVPDVLHGLESRLGGLRDDHTDFDGSDIKRELGATDLGAALDQDLALLREKLGNDYFDQERAIHVPASKLDSLAAEASALYGSDSRMLELIRRLRFEPLKDLLKPHFKATEQLAERQGKRLAPIAIEGDEALVDPDAWGPFCKSLVHLFRNAVDHGIEDPDTRLLADKDETATIRCRIRTDDDHLLLSIEDDGRGIDAALIRARTLDRELAGVDAVAAMGDEEALLLIFADGLSTRDEVSAISGRGVGLSVVQQELARLGGIVAVHSVVGRGTRFDFTLPYKPAPAGAGQMVAREHASQVLAPLPGVLKAFCGEHLRLAVTMEDTLREFTVDTLLDFTTLVSLDIGGAATLGLSMERPLLMEMARRFEPDFPETEIEALAPSVGAEIANTLFGNATVYFTTVVRHVTMGTPCTVSREDRAARIGPRAFRGFAGRCEHGAFIVFCILAEEERA
jgi:ABC-type amino acid transport substrate-binding protein/signal transduction histidine kinase